MFLLAEETVPRIAPEDIRGIQEAISGAIVQATKSASERGWEAVMLVIVIVGMLIVMGFIVRWLLASMDKRIQESNDREDARIKETLQREDRMSQRISALEDFSRTTLLKVVNDTSALATNVLQTMNRLTAAMEKRPCLLDGDEAVNDSVVRLGDELARAVVMKTREDDKTTRETKK